MVNRSWVFMAGKEKYGGDIDSHLRTTCTWVYTMRLCELPSLSISDLSFIITVGCACEENVLTLVCDEKQTNGCKW